MQGWIKFYNKAKGYGFIYTKDEADSISFGIKDWKDVAQPSTGDEVDFEVTTTKKGGLRAINIFLIKKNELKSADERISCPCCNKKIVPRISFSNGRPHKSYCPYCGGLVKNLSSCFIATAVYNDPNHLNVEHLRNFRDDYLLTTNVGCKFTDIYYKYSPPVADYIKNKPYLAIPVRKILDLFVWFYIKLSR